MASTEYKKVICAALLTVVAFLIGLVIGYYSRKASREVDYRTTILDKITREADDSMTQKLFDLIDTKRLDETLRKLTESPRLAGTNYNRDAGYYVHQEFLQYGLESEVVEYNVTLSYPDQMDENYVSVIDVDGTEVFRTAVTVAGDEVPPYNAFSPSGSVQSGLVFVNYARLSDFQLLKESGINCTGHIVIAKYGMLFRGIKVKNAYDAGAIGIILYSDPADFAPFSNVSGTYPDSIFLPDSGAQRGGLALNKGDQSTPGYPANEYAQRLTGNELKQRLPQIPCLPISYGNAYNILRHMSGNHVPATWKGGLNITYKLGPDLHNASKVVLNVKNKLEYRKIYNVVGKINGDIEPDRYVIMGSHRDAWVYGSSDPMSGSIVLLEIARVFGQLLQEGWRPRRTIMFCSWDAEEFGLVGSYEWVEAVKSCIVHLVLFMALKQSKRPLCYSMFPAGGHLGLDTDLLDNILKEDHPRAIVIKRLSRACIVHLVLFMALKQSKRPLCYSMFPAGGHLGLDTDLLDNILKEDHPRAIVIKDNIKLLYPNAVAYVNLDGTVGGNDTILLYAVPLLQNVFERSSDKVPDPTGRYNSVYESLRNNPSYKVSQIGGGSDHVPFITAGIPSISSSYQFVEKVWKGDVTPLYHSRYEDYHAYKLIDPEMKCSKTMASILAEITRNLANSRIIPFGVLHYADYIRTAINQFSDMYGQYFTSNAREYLHKSANVFYEASSKFMATLKSASNDNPLLIRQLNDRLMALERAFLIDEGLPRNPAYKHVLHSPGSSYYDGVSFPGLESIQQCYASEGRLTCFPKIERHLAVIIHRIYAAARVLDG